MPSLPTQKTLDKYGLNENDWYDIYNRQDGRCGTCGIIPSTGRFNIDHQHGIRGWKKMSPERRKTYVRGLLCYRCNRFLMGPGITVQTARGMVRFLEEYEERRRYIH